MRLLYFLLSFYFLHAAETAESAPSPVVKYRHAPLPLPSFPCRPIILTGPSGVGRRALVAEMRVSHPQDFVVPVSFTTRPIRGEEAQDVDYHFVDDKAFSKMLASGELAESRVGIYGGS